MLKLSGFTIDEIENFVVPPQGQNEILNLLADEIADKLKFKQSMTGDDFTTLAYVCGAVVRSVCNTMKCKSCKAYLIEKEQIEDRFPVTKYVEQVDIGGLTKPTEYAWEVSTHCFNVCRQLKQSEELFDKFLNLIIWLCFRRYLKCASLITLTLCFGIQIIVILFMNSPTLLLNHFSIV